MANRNPPTKGEIEQIAELCSFLMNWIGQQAKATKSVGIDREVNVMSGTEFVASLSVGGYGPEKIGHIKTIVDYIFADQAESDRTDKESAQEPHLSSATQTVLEGFLMITELMLADNQINRDDYRAVVVRTVERKRNKASASGWIKSVPILRDTTRTSLSHCTSTNINATLYV